jgi:hypothetical protein
MGSLRRFICALSGHESYRHFEKNRVYLRCVACGHESTGWTIDTRNPVVPFQPRRPQLVRRPALRKIA